MTIVATTAVEVEETKQNLSPNRNLILTGDACHYRNEVEHGVADALHDQVAGIASLRRLVLLRDAWDAQIWIGHDIDDWNSWPHAPEHVD